MKKILKGAVLITLFILFFACPDFLFAQTKVAYNNYEDTKNIAVENSIKKQETRLKSNLETVNNYFIGTFRLYDEETGKTYDFKAGGAFTYDYKQKNPPLIVDRTSFEIFTSRIEEYFSNKNLPYVLYPRKIGSTDKYFIEKQYIGEKKIDRAKFEAELSRRIRKADYSMMKIPFVKNKEAEQKAIQDEVVLLSSYTTKYILSDVSRTGNVIMAGEEINGTKLNPNEKYYYNTRIKAIYPKLNVAKVIVNNEFVDGTGGGLCQVSTTLFNAVLESGMQIDHRRSHTLAIDYVPKGRDAMVSDYNDFIFTNNFSNDVYIIYERTAANEITFKIYGSKSDKKQIKTWVTGSGLRYILHRKIGDSSVEEKFYSTYQTPN